MRNHVTRSAILVLLSSWLLVACGGPVTELEGPIPADADTSRCTEVDPHPIAEGIADKFDATYEEVMTWFCGGHPFDDILLALQTAELAERPASELLAIRGDRIWDQFWEELGLVSQPPREP